MKNGKFTKRRGVSSKALVLTLVVMLIVGCTIGGTLAWLTAESDTVTNTFTTSGIEIELKETKTDFKMIPGYTIDKDPKAKVLDKSEPCWLFVEIAKSDNLDNYISYSVADGWTAGKGTEGEDADGIPANVVYRKVEATDIGAPYSVLKDDKVTVKGEVTKDMMETAQTSAPTLTFTAYASQLYKSAGVEFSAAEAWTVLNPTNP